VREFENEGPRSDGPAVVWAGLEHGPALVVVDPSGAARHDDLPATWHAVAENYQVAWCRVPASTRSLEDIEDVLETLSDRRTPVTMVAAGNACAPALVIATQFSDLVEMVLLVDPVGDEPESPVPAQVVARSEGGDRDRVEPPLPLGHPDVVRGVTEAMTAAQAKRPAPG
jgi:hypothetical protein